MGIEWWHMANPSIKSRPRLVIAGLAGDSGKTLVALGISILARRMGLPVAAFKKGPDYIDAAWLAWATGRPCRNLDTWMMGNARVTQSFLRHAEPDGLNVIEGNRGVYDGVGNNGKHSTADLAKLLKAPVILVTNSTKMTHTEAALVLGVMDYDPEMQLAGVVLNRVGGERHLGTLVRTIESRTGAPVIGAIPRFGEGDLVPGRHLGLVTPAEHPALGELEERLVKRLEAHLDLKRLVKIARSAEHWGGAAEEDGETPRGLGLRIGVIQDSAFTFYYPENLEALERAGMELIPVSSLANSALPENLHALYIGGGFPETHGARIAANRPFLAALRKAARKGLPIYAECGGLMLLSRAMHWQGLRYECAGVFPVEVEVEARPQGHGYASLVVDQPNPFFKEGAIIRGHEFHYSRIVRSGRIPVTVAAVKRGVGCGGGRDGMIAGNVWASYTHLHAEATPAWARGMARVARQFSKIAAK